MFPNLLIFCLNIAFNVLHELSGRESGGREKERGGYKIELYSTFCWNLPF